MFSSTVYASPLGKWSNWSIEMKIQQYLTECGDLVVTLNVEFDALGSSAIRKSLEQIYIKTEPELVFLDIAEVNYIDSLGVGAIVYFFNRLRVYGRKLVITGVQGQPRAIFEMLRIHIAIPLELMETSVKKSGGRQEDEHGGANANAGGIWKYVSHPSVQLVF